MHIADSSVNLSLDEYKDIVNGRFRTFKCTSCEGKGWYWVHEDGYKRDPAKGEDEEDFYMHPCINVERGDCGGAGFNILFPEN